MRYKSIIYIKTLISQKFLKQQEDNERNETIKREIEQEKINKINEKLKARQFYENDKNFQMYQKKVNLANLHIYHLFHNFI